MSCVVLIESKSVGLADHALYMFSGPEEIYLDIIQVKACLLGYFFIGHLLNFTQMKYAALFFR